MKRILAILFAALLFISVNFAQEKAKGEAKAKGQAKARLGRKPTQKKGLKRKKK